MSDERDQKDEGPGRPATKFMERPKQGQEKKPSQPAQEPIEDEGGDVGGDDSAQDIGGQQQTPGEDQKKQDKQQWGQQGKQEQD